MGLGFWVEGLLSPKARKRQTNPLENPCNHLGGPPHPVIVAIRDNKDDIKVLLYSYYTTITGWGVLLSNHKSYIQQRLEHKKEATQSDKSIRATFLSGSTSEVLNGT